MVMIAFLKNMDGVFQVQRNPDFTIVDLMIFPI